MRFLALFFIIVPLTEMMVLFAVSDRIGGWTTLGLVVATAVIGLQILKQQGLSTLLRANQRLATGELPAQEILEGMLLAGAGALLLTPGFITDTIGFLLLTGVLRVTLARRLLRSGMVAAMGQGSSAEFRSWSSSSKRRSQGTVVEGEYVEGEFTEDAEPLTSQRPPHSPDKE